MGKGGPPHRFILPRPGFLSFTTSEPVTKDPASGCIMEEEWWHGEKRQELYGSHSPDAFAGKSLHTSVILSTPKSKALDECLRISGVLCFIKETDPRAIPWLYLHVQHKTAHSFPKIPTIHTQLPFFSLQGKILWFSSRQSNSVSRMKSLLFMKAYTRVDVEILT